MLNNAWPSLHWNQFDYYLHPAGSYFGTKVGNRIEHVAYNYEEGTVYLINHSLTGKGARNVDIELIDLDGNALGKKSVSTQTLPNTSKMLTSIPGRQEKKDVAFLRLILSDSGGEVLSRNVYWLSSTLDQLRFGHSTWYYTPVNPFANFTALSSLKTASISTTISKGSSTCAVNVTLQNNADVPAFFIRLNLVDSAGDDVVPVVWSDDYVTLWPREKLELSVSWSESYGQDVAVQVSGWNVGAMKTIKFR